LLVYFCLQGYICFCEGKYRRLEGNRWKYAGEGRVTKEDDVEGSISETCVRGYGILLTSYNG